MIIKTIKISLKSIMANKSRSLLCILGISISVASIVTFISLIYSFNSSLIKHIEQGLGTQQIIVAPGKMLNAKQSILEGGLSGINSYKGINSTLNTKDVEAVLQNVSSVETGAPQYETFARVSFSGKTKATSDVILTGTTPAYTNTFNYFPIEGHFFSQEDMKHKKNVMVLGQKVKEDLFGDSPAVGNKLALLGEEFEIIGVMTSKAAIGLNYNDRVYIPVATFQRLTNIDHASLLFFKATSLEEMVIAEKAIHGIIAKAHNSSDFITIKPDELISLINQIMLMLGGLATCITGISLITGGIGIVNVMLLSVQQRIREIGLRKSVGARNIHILAQFLTESIVLSFLGNILGLLMANLCIKLINWKIPYLAIEIPLRVLEYSLVFSLLIGIIFGILPALKATRVNPIESLRHE
ncbi:ABC transporter permease [Desulfotomaculum defluvii]